jgi:Universal stress protein UspA and related nucleotide-binding proteins
MSASTQQPPRTILLATDLSARCDRALDRAAGLAARWQAKLVAATIVEPAVDQGIAALQPRWRRASDPVRVAERRLLEDAADTSVHVSVVVEEGDPADRIAAIAERYHADLIVTGLARDEALGRFALGNTVDRLVRRSSAPILIVKNRVRGEYGSIVAATDFSAPSEHALRTAADWFPGRPLTVFHAYEVPFSGLVPDVKYRQDYRKVAVQECHEFLAKADLSQEIRQKLTSVVEEGMPAELLHQYVQEFHVDLVVLGAKGRNPALDLLIGNTATDILARLACDALLVRTPPAPA